MVVLGYDSTVPVTMDQMIHHASAVRRGAPEAFVVGDMPFGSYQSGSRDAIINASRFLKEAGCDAVKLEGGLEVCETVTAMVRAGISVMGHIGLTPQTAMQLGGYKVQGKTAEDAQQILADAKAIEEAGVFAMVLEGMPAPLASEITAAVGVPTIGIGAGPGCDGQVLVVNDLLGLYGEFKPKFVKRYANLGPEIRNAFAQYKKEVEDGSFPGPENSY